MEITNSQRETLRLALQFTMSEITKALDEGQCEGQESMVAVRRIRDCNDLLETLNDDVRSVTTYG